MTAQQRPAMDIASEDYQPTSAHRTGVPRRGDRVPARTALLLCLAATWMTACGGRDDSSEPQIRDEDVESARAVVKSVLKAGGLAVETEDGSLAVGYERNGESARMGQNLPTPEWLPENFPLPADITIQLVTIDLNQQKRMEGRSASVVQETLSRQVSDWASAVGWEIITADNFRVTVVSPGGDVIDAQAEDGVGMRLDMSRRSVAADRQRSAVEIVSAGTATVTLAGKTHTLEGECKTRGSSYSFEYYAADGSSFGTVQIQAADSEPQGSATYQAITGSGFSQYTINFPMHSGQEPVVRAAGQAFSVRGQFGSMSSAGMKAVPGIFAVRCES